MPKNIILLSDGTGNSAAKVWRTNVWRLFQSLELKGSNQIAFYDDGVGTSSFKPMAVLGGAFGVGLERNVIALYKFLCRNYQADDKIYGFGFSRGAFTIRIVASLAINQGLIAFDDEADLDKKAHAAYRAYRHAKYSKFNLQFPFRFARVLWDKLTLKLTKKHSPGIEFLGVWDTVAAYGLPVDEMTRGVDRWIWPLELPNTEFNSSIRRARHALAIDDERATFHPVLWDENDQNTNPSGLERSTSDEKLLQVWFTGMHANVGGGYPDDALANVSLSWMMAEARTAGLTFKEMKNSEPDGLLASDSAKDKDGRLYDSRKGLGGYYRYSPRKIADFYQPMQDAAAAAKKSKPIPKIHESVFSRIKVGAHFYAPIGLPGSYEVVTTGNVSIDYTALPPDTKTDPLVIKPNNAALAEGATNANNRHDTQQNVWDLVWRKRSVYFLSVFATGYLLLYPLFRDTYAFQELRTRLRFVSDTIRLVGAVLPGLASRWLDAYAREPAWFLINAALVALLIIVGARLGEKIRGEMRGLWVAYLPGTTAAQNVPSALKPWVEAALWWLKALVALLIFLAGAYLSFYPLIAAYVPWIAIPGEVGQVVAAYAAPPIGCVLGLLVFACFLPRPAVRALRDASIYRGTLWLFKYKIIPFVSAFGIFLIVLELGAHYAYTFSDSFGAFCTETIDPLKNDGFQGQTSRPVSFDASDNDVCKSTGVYLTANQKYQIKVVKEGANWTFWGEDSFLGGQPISRLSTLKGLAMTIMLPLRRTFDRPWSAIILRIGAKGNEEDFLDRDPPTEPDSDSIVPVEFKIKPDEALSETLTPKRDGQLFVYLNKPVWLYDYLPTTGKARIVIEKIDK
jgi:uncharacterized protein (DUF2235 family)